MQARLIFPIYLKNLFAYRTKAIVILLTLSSVAYVCMPSIAQAQTSSSGLRLTTSPLPLNLRTAPGKTITEEIRVRNAGGNTETVDVNLLKFSADATTGSPVLMDREEGDDYFDWVSFSPSTLTLAPNEWGTTKMTIKVPTSAAFGYYYAVTFGRAKEVTAEAGKATLLGAAATLVLLDVDVPGAKREAVIEGFKSTKKWYEFLPVSFEARIRNSGNVHVAPFGSLFIEQNGKTIDSIKFNASKGNILPGSPRTYTEEWSSGFPVYAAKTDDNGIITDKSGKPITSLTWNFTQADKLRFGKYTANLVLAYDNGMRDVALQQSYDFWVIPWRFLAGGLVVIAFFSFGVYMLARTIWRKAARE